MLVNNVTLMEQKRRSHLQKKAAVACMFLTGIHGETHRTAGIPPFLWFVPADIDLFQQRCLAERQYAIAASRLPHQRRSMFLI